MSLWQTYGTDADLETTKGVTIEFDSCKVTLARAGGSNLKYQRALLAKTRPYRAAIDAGTAAPEVLNDILIEVYAETVVIGWGTKVGDQYLVGIEPPPVKGTKLELDSNGLLPFTPKNVAFVLKQLPDFFAYIQGEAQKIANFRAEEAEVAAKN